LSPFKNNPKSNISSIILAETIPTLIQYKPSLTTAGGEDGYEQSPKGLLKFVKNSQLLDFPEISPSEIGLITEVLID